MRLLILGGTVFLGRHLVEAALARGHTVTLFNRGQHNPELFPAVEKLRGDRTGDLSALAGRTWDAVIDTCGYIPRHVAASARALADSVGHYTFISSISVYANPVAGTDESGAVATLADPMVETVTGETYGGLKYLCEEAAGNALPGRALLLRPGLIVGPHDPSDRFTYWVHRVAGGGEVLAPGRPPRLVQVIDVRDLAAWNLHLAEQGVTGVFNATGPNYALTMQQLLVDCRAAAGSDAAFTWTTDEFLLANKIVPWTELPLWIPEHDGPSLMAIDISKALAAGLRFRSLQTTVADTLAWDQRLPPDAPRRAGLAGEKETALLAAWHGRSGPDLH